jgi:hypothetical protein
VCSPCWNRTWSSQSNRHFAGSILRMGGDQTELLDGRTPPSCGAPLEARIIIEIYADKKNKVSVCSAKRERERESSQRPDRTR